MHACCLAFLPPVVISFLSYFFCSLLDFSLYCLLPSLPFPIFLHSVLPFYLSVFLVCFSVFLSDKPLFLHVFLACLRSFFCLSSFAISLPLSFILSLLPYSSKTILLPCILGFFFLPSLLSCFLSFFSHFCFLVFSLFLFSSSVALPYPTTKSRGLWSKGALPALLCVLFRCHLVSMFSQDLSFVPDSFVSCLGCVLVH